MYKQRYSYKEDQEQETEGEKIREDATDFEDRE